MTDPLAFIAAELEDLRAKHLYRPLRVMSAAQGPVTTVDGREVISLSSNDYLGLTHHPRVRAAAVEAVREFGVGSGAVRTIGPLRDDRPLEIALADYFARAAAAGHAMAVALDAYVHTEPVAPSHPVAVAAPHAETAVEV